MWYSVVVRSTGAWQYRHFIGSTSCLSCGRSGARGRVASRSTGFTRRGVLRYRPNELGASEATRLGRLMRGIPHVMLQRKCNSLAWWLGVSIPAMRWQPALFALLLPLTSSFAISAQDFPKGRFEKVVIQADPSQSYVLYLPTAYRSDRKWPILYVLDARSNGVEAGKRFLAGAERYGFIVASSNNTFS